MARLTYEEITNMTIDERVEAMNEVMEVLEGAHRLIMSDPLRGLDQAEQLPLGLTDVRTKVYDAIDVLREMIGKELYYRWSTERRMVKSGG